MRRHIRARIATSATTIHLLHTSHYHTISTLTPRPNRPTAPTHPFNSQLQQQFTNSAPAAALQEINRKKQNDLAQTPLQPSATSRNKEDGEKPKNRAP